MVLVVPSSLTCSSRMWRRLEVSFSGAKEIVTSSPNASETTAGSRAFRPATLRVVQGQHFWNVTWNTTFLATFFGVVGALTFLPPVAVGVSFLASTAAFFAEPFLGGMQTGRREKRKRGRE